MTEFLQRFLGILLQMAPYLLLGFVLAGLLHAVVPREWLARALGGHGIGPILRGALVGIPLPLCSCGVIPVAHELRRRGAGPGATASFLVSTPETGVDSIAASFAVLHPLLAVLRPIAALLTAVAAGLLVNRVRPAGVVTPDDGCCDHEADQELAGGARGLVGGMRYAFVDLFGEVAGYLLPAFAVTAALTGLLGPGDIERHIGSGLLQMLLVLLISVPIYVCATAATPVAAGLIVAGASPGAALVFLLAGPATNLVTITAAAKMLGRRGAVAYLVAVVTCSLALGFATDLLLTDALPRELADVGAGHGAPSLLEWLGGGLLLALLAMHLVRWLRR